jgi:hypothetical protein
MWIHTVWWKQNHSSGFLLVCDVIDGQFTGPSFFKGQLTGAIYVGFWNMCCLLEDVRQQWHERTYYDIGPTCHLTHDIPESVLCGQWIGHAVDWIGCDHRISTPLSSCLDVYETSWFWLRIGHMSGLHSSCCQCSHMHQWPRHSLTSYTWYCEMGNNVYQSWSWVIFNIFAKV